jgi:hypothetical protein
MDYTMSRAFIYSHGIIVSGKHYKVKGIILNGREIAFSDEAVSVCDLNVRQCERHWSWARENRKTREQPGGVHWRQ